VATQGVQQAGIPTLMAGTGTLAGKNLTELLEHALDYDRVPQWKVASACGIHPTALSLYASGKRAIHERHAAYLAKYFDVDLDVILDRADLP
jgi:plasmid maintenance system antidote protein VapI